MGKEGTRPRQPKDQRYANAYVFGAICPARDTGTALVLPFADTWAMQQHLNEISQCVTEGAHAVLTLDKAGWHTTRKLQVPGNITLLHLPPASPELNPTENIWQYLRQSYLSNRVFGDYDAVVEASSSAWNKLINEVGRTPPSQLGRVNAGWYTHAFLPRRGRGSKQAQRDPLTVTPDAEGSGLG